MAMQLLFSVLTVLCMMHVARGVLWHSYGQHERNVLGGVAAAYLDADDLLGNLLVHAAAGGHDGFGAALFAKAEWTAVGVDGRLYGAGWAGDLLPLPRPAGTPGLGGLARTRKTLWYFPVALLALSMVFAPWPMRNAPRAACFHSSTQHGWLRIMGGQPRLSIRLPG